MNLIDFVLNNNFILAAGSVWKFGCILPMGCCMSGEALDTICLAKELANMYSSSNNMAVSFYRRYRDDSFVFDT